MSHFPEQLPVTDTPGLRSSDYPRYSLGICFTFMELKERVPDMPQHGGYWKAVQYYSARYIEDAYLHDIHPISHSSHWNNETRDVNLDGVEFWVLSNRDQSYLEYSKDEMFLRHLRSVFDLDDDSKFKWKRWGKVKRG